MAVTTGKIADILDAFIETTDKQDSMINLCTMRKPDGAGMQDAGNYKWLNVEQQRPDIVGWDMTGEEQGIIQETCPLTLGRPHNDVIKQRADDMRNESYLTNAAKKAGEKQCTVANKACSDAMIDQGSLYYRSNKTSAFDFMGIGQRIMNEREIPETGGRIFILNDTDNLTFSSDLAGRQTLNGRPEAVWGSGQITQGVAGFDQILRASYLKNLDGGAAAALTVEGAHSFKPEAGAVASTGLSVTNIDYRSAVISINDASGLTAGDRVTFGTSQSVGLSSKVASGNLMTHVIVSKLGNDITVFPKPIAPASSDTSLTPLEGSYNNIHQIISAGDAVTRVNIDNSAKTNLFFDKSAISVMGGTIPADKYSILAGKNVIHDTLANGLEAYMLYDGNILETTFTCRLFVWYGINIENPSACGVAVKY